MCFGKCGDKEGNRLGLCSMSHREKAQVGMHSAVWQWLDEMWFFLTSFMFILERERERETEYKWGRDRERQGDTMWSRLQALSCQHRARRRAWTHELQDMDVSRSQTLSWLSHPGAPDMHLIAAFTARVYMWWDEGILQMTFTQEISVYTPAGWTCSN